MDGYITIGTKLDTKDLDAELKRLKKDLSRYEKENETLINQKAKLNLDTKEAEKKLEELNRKIDSNMEKQRALILQRDSIPEYQRQFDSTTYDNLNRQILSLQKEYDKYGNMHKKTLDDINKQESAIKVINSKLKENAQAQSLIKEQVRETTAELQNQTMLENISGGLSKIISKVGKWGLALIGIRGAYSLISRAMSTLSQEDENLRNQIQYIQWALAKVVEPLVKWIMDAVYQIMQWINAIWRTLFGADLFKGPKEFASSMKSASSSAKEIRKELAGFDEMNILGNNTKASAGTGLGGGGTNITPIFNDKPITNAIEKVKKAIEELKTNTDDALEAVKDPKQFERAYGKWGELMRGVTKFFAGTTETTIGLGEAIGGLWTKVKGMFKGNFVETVLGQAKWDTALRKVVKGIKDSFSGIVISVKGGVKGGLDTLTDWFDKITGKSEKEKQKVMEQWGQVVGHSGLTHTTSGGRREGKSGGILGIVDDYLDSIKGKSSETSKSVKNDFSEITGSDGKTKQPDENTGLFGIMKKGFNKITEYSKNAVKEISNDFSKTNGEKVANSFSTGFKSVLDWLTGIKNKLIELASKIWPIKTKFESTGVTKETTNSWLDPLRNALSKIGIKIPKLARGTILNNPGRGVPIGGAIAGESGREAVLPLSDARLLEELGSTIGRYITINLTNVTELDGTTIARKMKNLTNNDNFLRNR